MSLSDRVRHSVSWLAIAQGGRRLLTLVTTAILARLIAPEDFGLVNMAMILVGLLSVGSDIGLTSALVQKSDLTEVQICSVFWLNVAACWLLATVGIALSWPIALAYHEPRVVPIIMVLALMLPLNGFGQVSDALLQRDLLFKRLALVELTSTLAASLVGVAVALAGGGVWALVAQYLTTSAVMSLGRLVAAGWRPRARFSFAEVRQFLGFSTSVLFGVMVNYATRNIDNALIGSVLGARALGYYSLAYNLILLPGMAIGSMVNRVLFPALSALKDDLARLRSEYVRGLRMLAAVSIPAIVGLCATAPLFVHVVYGPKWDEVAPLMRILLVIGLFEAVSTSGVVFWAMGRPLVLVAWAGLMLVVMTAAFAIGVRWGATGVAWSYVIVSPPLFLGPHLLAARLISLKLSDLVSCVALPLVAAGAMGVAIVYGLAYLPFSIGWVNLAACVIAGALLYAAVFFGGAVAGRGSISAWLAKAPA
jgi:O-antigen/teichoic acid export membrane protein